MNRQLIESFIRNNIEFTFSRSGGKGGQNVNKVNTKVTAKLDLSKITCISPAEQDRLYINLKNKVNSNNEIIIHVEQERKQYINKEIAVARLISIIIHAIKPKKKRVKTKPSLAAVEKRLRHKKIQSLKKQQRNNNF